MILETERLILKKVEADDDEFFYRLWNSPNWVFMVGDRGVHNVAEARRQIEERILSCYQANGYGMYKMVLKSENSTIGICGYSKRDYLSGPDVGFAVLPEYQRNGYSFEAAVAVMDYGRNHFGLNEIYGMTTEKNEGSKKLLSRIGLKRTGMISSGDNGLDYILYSS